MNNLSLNYKKIGLIALFLVVVLVAGYFLYAFFFKNEAPLTPGETPGEFIPGAGLPESGAGTPTSTAEPTEGGLPGSGSVPPGGEVPGGPLTVEATEISAQAGFPSVNSGGSLQFYNRSDNRFYTVDAAGKLIALSDKQFPGVSAVTWAPSNNKAILEYPDGSKIRYDFATGDQVTLPKHWEDFDFSPAGDKIVSKSLGLDPDNRWLVVANDDGSKATTIEPLGENADSVISSWSPNNQTVAMYTEGIDFNRKEVFFLGQNGENFKSTITEGRGFQPKWSPQGDQLLYSVYSADNDYKPTLWLVGAQGDTIGSNRRPLSLNTWAEKCSFAGSELYCAVPSSLERGAGLFPSTANTTTDLLYRINPSTGGQELINTNSNYAMTNLSVSPDGQYVYFLEGGTNILRKIKVK